MLNIISDMLAHAVRRRAPSRAHRPADPPTERERVLRIAESGGHDPWDHRTGPHRR
ncbi:hypothetical protein BCF33_1785 [Hasllibacter halocynthiae]|uniref:Uncharacterized protein n=1 Tax=Hasllibacter halocynthiae TaxID=595589 RepID=A0A2T0X1U6_9RHOB|nr:hypothetical protein [Hasllibacter halocynthiae]PRY92922.1 hypothetical protein BCF33_1785 [Hasllibacter halocynthiae]